MCDTATINVVYTRIFLGDAQKIKKIKKGRQNMFDWDVAQKLIYNIVIYKHEALEWNT